MSCTVLTNLLVIVHATKEVCIQRTRVLGGWLIPLTGSCCCCCSLTVGWHEHTVSLVLAYGIFVILSGPEN
jgi:hypothetical protein